MMGGALCQTFPTFGMTDKMFLQRFFSFAADGGGWASPDLLRESAGRLANASQECFQYQAGSSQAYRVHSWLADQNMGRVKGLLQCIALDLLADLG